MKEIIDTVELCGCGMLKYSHRETASDSWTPDGLFVPEACILLHTICAIATALFNSV